MTLFNEFVDDIIGVEGGYSNNLSDSGGKTKYGITRAVASKYGYLRPMVDLPKSLAKQIYKENYWDRLSLNHIELISPSIAREIFDTGINQGVGRASEYLQTSLNSLNRQEKDYDDLIVDGDIGGRTVIALQRFVGRREGEGEVVLLRALNCLQGAFYIQLSQYRKKDEDFVYGWLLSRVVI